MRCTTNPLLFFAHSFIHRISVNVWFVWFGQFMCLSSSNPFHFSLTFHQIEKPNRIAAMTGDIDCVSILNKLILLTEQYRKLNVLLQNKQDTLKQRVLNLRKRRLKHKRDMHQMWIALTQIESNNAHESILIRPSLESNWWYIWVIVLDKREMQKQRKEDNRENFNQTLYTFAHFLRLYQFLDYIWAK